MARSKFRVKVVVENNHGFTRPETKYVIQRKWIFGWDDEHSATNEKEWAYRTCEEMNTDYETIRAKNKTNKK
jgi:hypothetical protein